MRKLLNCFWREGDAVVMSDARWVSSCRGHTGRAHHHLEPFSEHPRVPSQLCNLLSATRGAVGASQDVDDGQRLRCRGYLGTVGEQ